MLRLLQSPDGKNAMVSEDMLGPGLKEWNSQLTEPVHDIISCVVQADGVPVACKMAHVVLLCMKGNKQGQA